MEIKVVFAKINFTGTVYSYSFVEGNYKLHF